MDKGPISISSPEELRDLAESVQFRFEEIDPRHEQAIQYLREHDRKIVEMGRNNLEMWQAAYDLWFLQNRQDTMFCYRFEQDEWQFEANLYFNHGHVQAVFQIVSRDWAQQRSREMEQLFSSDASEGVGSESVFLIHRLAEKLGTKPTSEFRVSQKFNPSKVKDGLVRGWMRILSILSGYST